MTSTRPDTANHRSSSTAGLAAVRYGLAPHTAAPAPATTSTERLVSLEDAANRARAAWIAASGEAGKLATDVIAGRRERHEYDNARARRDALERNYDRAVADAVIARRDVIRSGRTVRASWVEDAARNSAHFARLIAEHDRATASAGGVA